MTSRFDEEKGAFIVTGTVTFCVLGRNENGTPLYLENDSPFEHEIAVAESGCKGELSFEPRVSIVGCSYYLSDESTAEVKAELKICGEIVEQKARTMLTDLKVLTDKPKEKKDSYALKICYCSENDDIWEIAKKYSTSISAILEENELTDDKVTQHGMLLIPLMN